MNVVMIHEITDKILKLDLNKFDIITFDDGLYSQYKNYKYFLKFNKPLYFFISTNIVCPEDEIQNEIPISCTDAHELFFETGCKNNYMKWSQIKEIYNTKNCFIGGHSHGHKKLKELPLKLQSNVIKDDIIEMMYMFQENKICIKTFCYPYNNELITYNVHLKKFGITTFFGKERIKVETLEG